MQFEFTNELPIYEQIAECIINEVAVGKYQDGRILSVRDYSLEFGVNPNTVQRAMVYLEQLGIVYSKRGEGRFVGDRQKAVELNEQTARQKCKKFLQDMKKLGFCDDDVLKILKEVNCG